MKQSSALLWISSVQQTLAMFAGLVIVPLLVARAIGADQVSVQNMVTCAMFVCGISTALQSVRIGWIGSGYLLIMGSSSLFIAPSIMAGKMGGLPLIFGMTMLMAPVELILAPLSRYFKRITPPVLPGVLVILLACSVLPVCMQQLGGGNPSEPGQLPSIALGMFTILCIMAAQFSPWQMVRSSSIVIGIIAGTIVGSVFGMTDFSGVRSAEWLSYPRLFWYGKPAFSADLILPFGIAYFLTTLETYGDIHAAAYVCNEKPGTVDHHRIRGGLVVDAVGSLFAGFCGTTSNTTFSGNIAISKMSGQTSPKVGYAVCFLLLILCFLPKLSAAVSSMPAGVLGGSMIVAEIYLFQVGLTMLRDSGKTDTDFLIAGFGIAFGLGVQQVPSIAENFPSWIAEMARSGVCSGTVLVILLYLMVQCFGKRTVSVSAPLKKKK